MPLDIWGKLLVLDTTDFDKIDYDELFLKLENFLEDSKKLRY